MEYLTKREFFERYASAKDKRFIKNSSILAYLCAVISLFWGLDLNSYTVVIDVILVVGLGLGIQIAKSRVCAVLLFIYACFNTVVMTVHTGKLFGWWLILAGIFAVVATFRLEKQYRKFMDDAVILEQTAEPETSEQAVSANPQFFATLLPFCGMFLGLIVIYLSIHPWFLNTLVGNADSAKALLLGYLCWYISTIAAVVFAVLLTIGCVFVAVLKGLRTIQAFRLMIICLAFPVLFGGLMILSEDVPSLVFYSWKDLMQLESGQLQEATVWLSPKSSPASFPGPYTEGQPEPFVCYSGIGEDIESTWRNFYVPNYLGFSLDADALYHESQSVDWNKKNAQQYRLQFTDHFLLVVLAEPVDTETTE